MKKEGRVLLILFFVTIVTGCSVTPCFTDMTLSELQKEHECLRKRLDYMSLCRSHWLLWQNRAAGCIEVALGQNINQLEDPVKFLDNQRTAVRSLLSQIEVLQNNHSCIILNDIEKRFDVKICNNSKHQEKFQKSFGVQAGTRKHQHYFKNIPKKELKKERINIANEYSRLAISLTKWKGCQKLSIDYLEVALGQNINQSEDPVKILDNQRTAVRSLLSQMKTLVEGELLLEKEIEKRKAQ